MTLTQSQIRAMLDELTKAEAALTMVRGLPPGATLNHEQWRQVFQASSLGYVRDTLLAVAVREVEVEQEQEFAA